MKPPVRIATMKPFGISLGLFGMVLGTAALWNAYDLWLTDPVGLPCQVVSHDGTLDIDDGFAGRKIFLINGGNSLLLAGAGGRVPYGPVPMTLLNGLPSRSPVHVEFCGQQTVRLSADGYKKVYELTQKRAEADRIGGMTHMGGFAIFAYAAAMLGYWLVRRASASLNE
jgi:hypothetical protein